MRCPATNSAARSAMPSRGTGCFRTAPWRRTSPPCPNLLGWDTGADRCARRRAADALPARSRALSDRAIRTNSPAASSSASAWRGRWRPSRKVLLMDEPFGALDPIIRAKAQDDLLAIQKRFGTTIVLVTHDMEEAIHLGDRIAVMDAGQASCNTRPPAEILARPATAFVETLIGTGERPFRLLSLGTVGEAVEPGAAEGEPIRGDAQPARRPCRDAVVRARGAAGGRCRTGAAGRPRHRRRAGATALHGPTREDRARPAPAGARAAGRFPRVAADRSPRSSGR